MNERPDLEERFRRGLHAGVPPALDPGAIMAGARRTRARRRVTILSAAAGLVLVAGVGAFAVDGVVHTRQYDAPAAAGRPVETASTPGRSSAAQGPAVELPDGLTARPQGDGFCVQTPRSRAAVCHAGPGSVVVSGATRRWLVFGGPANAQGYALERSGTWAPMEWRAASRVAPQAYAYVPDPAGNGPFRVREQGRGEPRIWEG